MVLELWLWESSTLPDFFQGLVSDHKPFFLLNPSPIGRIRPFRHMTIIDQWPDLRRIADEEVTRLVRELPKTIRPLVEAIPIVLEKKPGRKLVSDGVDPDVMGLFVGPDYSQEGQDPIPPSIFLFLDNIRDEAEGVPAQFRQEVRKTILHEIGHYLGLNEDDLFKRDLD